MRFVIKQDKPFKRPPSVACGTMSILPGRSNNETCFSSSVSLSFTLNTSLTVFLKERKSIKSIY